MTSTVGAVPREAQELADEQAALRRVATLVAQGAAPAEVFAAVSAEVERVFRLDPSTLDVAGVVRFEPGPELVVVGVSKVVEAVPLGSRFPPDELFAPAHVLGSERSARIRGSDVRASTTDVAAFLLHHGYLSQVASPIIVDGHLWGAVSVNSGEELPPDTEARLDRFTDLVATAIANAESRRVLEQLADEQAALRRVATLVAQGAAPADVFAAVSAEVERVFGLDAATLGIAVVGRFEPGSDFVVVGVSKRLDSVPLGSRWTAHELCAPTLVDRTQRSARIRGNDVASAGDAVAGLMQWYRSQVASPIVVDGHLWGAISVNARDELPHDTEERLERFTDLVATAIANAESSAELAASRRRIVAASDDARRRIERDLHDGVQQQLVTLGLELGAMEADPPSGGALKRELADVTANVSSVLDALVEIARGIHPAILSQGGLAAALKALARRSATPVKFHAQINDPLPDEVEVATYYIAAELLTNAAKHARASVVHMLVDTDGEILTLLVQDDGIGGVDPGGGSGLVGLQDRVEALGGSIEIDSVRGRGTTVVVALPISPALEEPGPDWLSLR